MASRRSARLSTITQTTSKSISASAGGRALPTATVTGNDDGVVDDVATMQTPAKKRKLSHPPVTPTPALIGRMLERTPATVNKAVDLNHTASAHEISPERSLDSTTLLSKAEAHLIKVDPTLKRVIDAHHCDVFDSKGLSEPIDPFQSLAAGIMAQQISGAAANAVKTKFIGLFAKSNTHRGPPHFPPPSLVAAAPLATLKTAGLSQRKAEYIQGLAERFVDESLSKAMLEKAPDEKVMNTLVAVRGLGQWSVEMFCCFGLKRMDVFSTGDLGVQYVTTERCCQPRQLTCFVDAAWQLTWVAT